MTCNCLPKNIIAYFFFKVQLTLLTVDTMPCLCSILQSKLRVINIYHFTLSFDYVMHLISYQSEKAFSTPESKLNGLKVIKDWKKLNCLATTFQRKGKTHKQITKNQPPKAKHVSILRCSWCCISVIPGLGRLEARGPSNAVQ